MSDGPRARAANSKDFLEVLEQMHPGSLELLRAREPPEVLGAIEHSARTDWISIDILGIHTTEVVLLLGKDRAREVWRRYSSERFIRSPAIKALFDGAVRLFGLSVNSLVKRIPLAFQQSYRDCGTASVICRERETTVLLRDIPRSLAGFPAYEVLFHGMFLGLYDIVRQEPQLEYAPDLPAGRIDARFGW